MQKKKKNKNLGLSTYSIPLPLAELMVHRPRCEPVGTLEKEITINYQKFCYFDRSGVDGLEKVLLNINNKGHLLGLEFLQIFLRQIRDLYEEKIKHGTPRVKNLDEIRVEELIQAIYLSLQEEMRARNKTCLKK